MSDYKNKIVLTATVDPSVGNGNVVLSDKFTRLQQYLDTIKRLISESEFDCVIFCENSDFPHDYSEICELAESKGKAFEVLRFMGSNDLIRLKGKSYGESEILNHAVLHSRFLADDAATFYKMTGRIYVENVNRIVAETWHDNVLIRWDVKKKEVDTRFFKVQVGFYQQHLFKLLDRMDESCNASIEEVYFDVLKGNPDVYSFATYPDIKGVCASLGKPYDLGVLKSCYRIFQLKAGLLDLRRL